VEYGTDSAFGAAAAAPGQTAHHAVTLTGLAAGTLYHYRVAGAGRILAEGHSFSTARGEEDPRFTFAVLGDSGKGNGAQYAVAERIKAIRPDFVLHTGDVVYPAGAARHFDDRYFRPYRDLIATTPFFLSLGNHDVATANGQAYLDAFPLPSNNPAGTKRYYSFEYGNARFIALDSNQPCGPGSPMYAWLAAELARPRKFWTFAFFHHPPYSSGHYGNTPGLREAWSPLFERSRVAMVFSGHEHSYERTVPIRDFDPAGPGVVYVVTGGGGGELYKVGRSAWTAQAASTHHVVRVEVRGCALDLQAITPDGATFDRTTIDRCGEPSGRLDSSNRAR
jgi:calcineurin-like phosphoesterase family protein